MNAPFLKKMYIVTDPADAETINLCATFKNVEVLLCPDAHKNGAAFNKSGLIKYAQINITPNHREDWIIIIDADTILPTNFWSESIASEPRFNKDTVYLISRKIYVCNADLQNDNPQKTQSGAGFFQLYYNKSRMYSDFSETAAVCDTLFQELFKKQQTLKGYCIHLGQNGMDWNGRVSQTWT
jgi:hypothetical protein